MEAEGLKTVIVLLLEVLERLTGVLSSGGPVTEKWAAENGADGYSDNANEAVRLAFELLGVAK